MPLSPMRAFTVLFLLALGLPLAAAPGDPGTEATLILAASEARPGDTVLAGIRLKMKPGWHTYWKNPGDSGTATAIQWELPPGITAGAIQWPTPEKYTVAPLTTFVLHGEVVLLVPLQLAPDIKAGPHELKANVSWLECEDICLPGDADVRARLIVGPDSKPGPNEAPIQAAQKRLPPTAPAPIPARWDGLGQTNERTLAIRWSPPAGTQADFLPYPSDAFALKTDLFPGTPEFRKTVLNSQTAWPREIPGLLVALHGTSIVQSLAATVQITDSPANTGSANPPAPLAASLPLMLLFAFVGGLILNVMPCVLPVIALKVLGFVNQSRETPARVRLLGLTYGAGVLVCFAGLALAAIAVKQAGGLASWGMLLQNQVARVVLTIVMTLVALNLFGVFEVILSGQVAGTAGDLAAREGLSGAFFNGLLAAVLATPCTAPFMGSALAFAFTQPAAIILLVFLSLGLGLASPFVLLCWQPAWLKLLPRPGLWMEQFKIAMGFPMLATAVWLFWFTAPRYGTDGVLFLGLFLVVLAAAAWTFGTFVQRGRNRRGLALLVATSLFTAGYFFLLEGQLHWRRPAAASDRIAWQPWSPEAVASARARGQPVLVDFTADNCLNCKLNKITSLEIPATRERLRQLNVAAFLADFTDKDQRIAAILQKYQRGGVPLVLVFPADPQAEPQVLPPVLTPSIVLDALNRAAPTPTR